MEEGNLGPDSSSPEGATDGAATDSAAVDGQNDNTKDADGQNNDTEDADEADTTSVNAPVSQSAISGAATAGSSGQWGPLLDLIAGKESGGNYEAMYPSTTMPGMTKMTITQVINKASGAVGKYQQLPRFLAERARRAGLDPDKDLFSPANQDKIILDVNIKGNRQGGDWLAGKITDEQFMQGLSQEFASLPNAQGKFHYPNQSSAMTPGKVMDALRRVKRSI